MYIQPINGTTRLVILVTIHTGYQLPHPLEHRMLIKVQTTGQTAAPVDVLKAAIVDLQGETEALDRGFRDGVAAVRERQMQI